MSDPIRPATTPPRDTAVPCRRAPAPIDLDGTGGWEHAYVVDGFASHWLAGRSGATGRTRARLLWDDEHLYFLAEMVDEELISSSSEDGARLWLGDVFELFFKPDAAAPGYYEFQVNPAGARLNMYLPERARDAYDRCRTSREFAWRAAVRRTNDGWAVAGRIPWSDFAPTGGAPLPGDTWRFALCRYDYSTGEPPVLTSSAPLQRADFHRYEDWSELRFVD